MRVLRLEKTLVFTAGGIIYGLCEIVWRGYTHPTMIVLGGVCFLGLYLGEKRFSFLPLPLRCLAGGTFITGLELVTGCIVNKALRLSVWDYSEMPLNLYGQICPQFFCAWVLLCLPALALCRYIAAFFDRVYL